MSTVVTSLAEYLTTSYHPDRDYVDGKVQERNWESLIRLQSRHS